MNTRPRSLWPSLALLSEKSVPSMRLKSSKGSDATSLGKLWTGRHEGGRIQHHNSGRPAANSSDDRPRDAAERRKGPDGLAALPPERQPSPDRRADARTLARDRENRPRRSRQGQSLRSG